MPQMNLCSALSRLAKRYRQHFKCLCTLISLFSQNLMQRCIGPFFWMVKNREHTQARLARLSVKNKLTIPKWLILSTYTSITDICTNITEKKCENWTYVTHEIWKYPLYFDYTSYVCQIKCSLSPIWFRFA